MAPHDAQKEEMAMDTSSWRLQTSLHQRWVVCAQYTSHPPSAPPSALASDARVTAVYRRKASAAAIAPADQADFVSTNGLTRP
eukprot:COSAG03_NODE_11770_length_577_cov_0.700837_2_plen_82_part_01